MLKNRLLNLSNREVLGILIAVALASSGLSLVVNTINNVDTTPDGGSVGCKTLAPRCLAHF